MTTTGPWTGFVWDVFSDVEAEIEANKDDIGLRTVTMGDGDRRNNEPLAVCYIGPTDGGVRPFNESGRRGDTSYIIPVQPIIVAQTYREDEAHQVVIEMAERVANVLDNAGPLGGAQSVRFPSPFTPGPIIGQQGAYETSAALEVEYIKLIDRTRDLGDDA